jgi:hypothetical protein
MHFKSTSHGQQHNYIKIYHNSVHKFIQDNNICKPCFKNFIKVVYGNINVKGKVRPRTGQEGQRRSRGIALLFLQPQWYMEVGG